jgi:hypothetical protein
MNAQQLADRYVAVWNEKDGQSRRRMVEQLWIPDGEHFVGVREARGYDELEKRIVGSHEKNVRDGGNRFRAVPDARQLRDVVSFHWEMLRGEGDEVAAVGLEFLIVDEQGRIRTDYQFIVN